ncbi:MAG: hypothetical protein J6X27_05745 [Bacteroidaceae bacterium]|nr:hypothetical protein [Bacteroidaceae bacterium]
MDKRYDAVIYCKLQAFARVADWQGMLAYLQGLSNSAFRTASYVLAEHVLPPLEAENFWKCFHTVALTNTKAFLMTFLKAALQKYHAQTLDFQNSHFVDFARATMEESVSLDRQKTLKAILPVLRTPIEVQSVLDAFCGTGHERKLNYLVFADESLACYYVTFCLLRQIDHTPDLQVKMLRQIIRRSTPLAYNFVSIMRAYFGLEQIRGNYSLSLQPYELSRIENGYDAFLQVMNKIK